MIHIILTSINVLCALLNSVWAFYWIKRLQQDDELPFPEKEIKMDQRIFYLCDKKGHCSLEWPGLCINDECFHTSDVNHAKNGPADEDDLNTRFKKIVNNDEITYWEIKDE